MLEWMRQVEGQQAFGVREALAAPGSGVKCGWFGEPDETCLRTHAVAVLPSEDTRATVVVALTAQPYADAGERDAYRADVLAGLSVEAEHERVAGPLLRSLLTMSLTELGYQA
ncbi:hypothetical protein ACFSTC_11075 [Nonomuraea ferruginea]